jgi:hypothetical protein
MIGVFLSYSNPVNLRQQRFLAAVSTFLQEQNIEPLTLTRSNYDMDAPLAGIRRLMVGSCGLLSVAFRRSWINELKVKEGADLPGVASKSVSNVWLTSAYTQIEPAMAYQLGLPILILREQGVLAEGVLEQGVTGMSLPDFELLDEEHDLSPLSSILHQWIGRVRNVYDKRGNPPQLY